jgi:hypothetical protein
MFLGLSDPDPLVTSTDLDPDPSIIKQKHNEKPKFQLLCDFFMAFTSVPDPEDPHVFGPPGCASKSVRRRYASGSLPKCHGSTTLLSRCFLRLINFHFLLSNTAKEVKTG